MVARRSSRNNCCLLIIHSTTSQKVIGADLGVPADTKLLLTKHYSKIIIFEKLRISRVIPRKSPSFPKVLTVQNRLKITKNNSQGIIFGIISCQRVSAGFLSEPRSGSKPDCPYKWNEYLGVCRGSTFSSDQVLY